MSEEKKAAVPRTLEGEPKDRRQPRSPNDPPRNVVEGGTQTEKEVDERTLRK